MQDIDEPLVATRESLTSQLKLKELVPIVSNELRQ